MNTDCAVEPGKSGGGPPQSKTWRKFGAARRTRSVLECASPLALWNAPITNPNAAGATGRAARRTKLGDDGNLMKADGNSFPVFILGWTIGAIGVGISLQQWKIMIVKCSCQKSMKLIALVFFIAATVSAQNSSDLWQYGNKFYDAAGVKAIPTVRGKVQWVQDGVVGFETEKATSEIAVGSSVVPTDWEPDSLIAVTNFPDMANATVNKWAMYKMVKIGIYNGYKSQPIELYDCGKPYVPPPPKPLTPEQIAAAKAKAEASKKSGAAAALKSNQDAAAKGDSYGLMRMGERYRDGDGVDKDLAKAKDYLQKAADAGSPTAADELSKLKQ